MSVLELYATDSCSSLFSLSYFIQSPCFDCHSHLSPVFTDIIQKSSERKYKNISFLRETAQKSNLCSTFVKAHHEGLLFLQWHWCVPLLFWELWCILGTVVQSSAVLHCFTSPVPLCSIKWCFKEALMFQASFEPNANLHAGMGQETAQADSLPDTSTRCFLCAAPGKKFGGSFYLSGELCDCASWFRVGARNRVEDARLVFQTTIWLSVLGRNSLFSPHKKWSPLMFALAKRLWCFPSEEL